MQPIQKDQKDNLLSQNSIQAQQKQQPEQSQPKVQTPQTAQQQSDNIIDPIEQLIKKNNVMPLLAVIDKVDLYRKIQDKPLLSILATKFIPLDKVLKDKQIKFVLDQDRRTPLHYAIQANDVKAAAWLIQKGNPNQQDNFGNTPILDAIRLDRRRCFLLCLKNKLYDQRAPIFAAMYNRHWQLKVLYGMKIDIFAYRDQENKTAFQRALEYNSFDCAEFMVKVKPQLDVDKCQGFTESRGLVRKLKKIQKKMSTAQRLKQFLKPLLILFHLYIGLSGTVFGFTDSIPYENTRPFYLTLFLLIASLYGLTYIFGTFSKMQYTQKNTLSQVQNEPNYKTLQDICPVCVHFTNYKFDHCYTCGCCVEKYHLHSYVCINRSNEVFWVLTQFIWLYMSWQILSEFLNFLRWTWIGVSSVSSFQVLRMLAMIEHLFEQRKFIAIAWLFFLVFLFLYQFFCCLSLLGMMCMRRKFQQVIQTEKYLHLYQVVKIDDNFMNKQKKIFERGFFGGLKRCARNLAMYFFTSE